MNESVEKKGEGASGAFESASALVPEAKLAPVEVIPSGKPTMELSPKAEQVGVLQRLSKQNALEMQGLEASLGKDKTALASVREGLGMPAPEVNDNLAVERQLEELRAKQMEIQHQQEVLLADEMRVVVEEKVGKTLEIFHTLSAEDFALVLKTGKIPLAYRILSFIFGIDQVEEEFVMILAQAYEKKLTTVYQISHEFTQFSVLQEKMKPAIIDVASERVLEGEEQKQIEGIQDEQKAIENGESPEQIGYTEPKQIAETSGAGNTSSAAPSEGPAPASESATK